MRFKYIIAALMLVPAFAFAQNVSDDNEVSAFDEFKQRLGFHTNVISWILATPNVGVEYDVVNDGVKKISVVLSGKYNWDNKHTNPFSPVPRYVYNIAGAKLEGRYYFRTRKREAWENDMLRDFSELGSYSKSYVRKRLVLAKNNPRSYRAYYIAPYITFDNYDIKLTETGYKGNAAGVGLSFGYNTPLYQYDNGDAVDFQLGASVGAVYSAYKEYEYDSKRTKYIATLKETGKILPYPVISDVNLSFVYRFNSIRNQVAARDEAALEEMRELYDLRKTYNTNQASQRSVDGVEQFISLDSIIKMNRKVNTMNQEIRRINELYASADSTIDSSMLLVELPKAYAFLELTEKEFIKASKQTLPNIDSLSSLKDLKNELVNRISRNHAGVQSLDSLMIESYYVSREKAIAQTNDTLARVPLLDYLVNTIPAVVNRTLMAHNTEYFGTRTVNKEADINSVAKVETLRRTPDSPIMKNSAIGFLTRTDTLYLKQPEAYTIKGKIEVIEIENTIKRLALEELTGIKSVVEDSKEAEVKKSSEKKSKKKKNKKDAAEETVEFAEDAVKEIAEQAAEAAEDAVKETAEQAAEVAKGVKETAEQAVEAAEDAVKKTAEKVAEELTTEEDNK